MKKINNKKAFSMIECIFSTLLLSIITISILYSIFVFSKFQNHSNEEIEKLNDIENTMIMIKNNIKNDKEILDGVDEELYKINIESEEDIYFIQLECKINGVDKKYEMYVCKKD